MKLKNPLLNHRVKVEKLKPTAGFLLMRIDPMPKKTAGGVLLPDGTRDQGLTGGNGHGGGPASTDPSWTATAVIIGCGPDVEGLEVGQRVVLPAMPVPVITSNEDEELPLGMLDYRDIMLVVK